MAIYEGKQNSGVSPKWVKSNRCRKKEEKKESVKNNGQLSFHGNCLDQLTLNISSRRFACTTRCLTQLKSCSLPTIWLTSFLNLRSRYS